MLFEPCSSFSVVYTDSPKINDHIFGKAIRWADQNPDDLILWIRQNALTEVPNIDVEWSAKISALRRIHFHYNSHDVLSTCIDEAVKNSTNSDVAAIMCSISLPKNSSQIGSLLAALAHFCKSNNGRAVVAVELEENEDTKTENKNEMFVENLKKVSMMYTRNVFTFDGEQFTEFCI